MHTLDTEAYRREAIFEDKHIYLVKDLGADFESDRPELINKYVQVINKYVQFKIIFPLIAPWAIATVLIKGKVTLEDFTAQAIHQDNILAVSKKSGENWSRP